MAKRRSHKEIEQQIQNKLRKVFLTWFIAGSAGATLLMLLETGSYMNKETDLLLLLFFSVVFVGLPLAFTAYWSEKWTILGYSTMIESIITYIIFLIAAILGFSTKNMLGVGEIILIVFIVNLIANLVHKKQYKKDAENGTIPDINLEKLDGRAWSAPKTSVKDGAGDNKEDSSDDEYDEEEDLL